MFALAPADWSLIEIPHVKSPVDRCAVAAGRSVQPAATPPPPPPKKEKNHPTIHAQAAKTALNFHDNPTCVADLLN